MERKRGVALLGKLDRVRERIITSAAGKRVEENLEQEGGLSPKPLESACVCKSCMDASSVRKGKERIWGLHACMNPDRVLPRHHKSEEIVSALCERGKEESLSLLWTSIFGSEWTQRGKGIGKDRWACRVNFSCHHFYVDSDAKLSLILSERGVRREADSIYTSVSGPIPDQIRRALVIE